MPLSRPDLSRALAALLVFSALAGCRSNPKVEPNTGDDKPSPIVGHFKGDDLYANIPSERIQIKDEDVKFGEKDADYELIAKWATERRDLVTWLLHQEVPEINEYGQEEHRYKRVWPNDDARPETRFDQAVAIANHVVEKIPDNTRERVRLAWCLFNKGSACYWAIDAYMNKIHKLMGEHGDNREDPAIKAEVDKLYDLAAKESRDMLVYHRAALQHFTVYMNAMPMDRAVLDFVWKIHFELGDFREAVRYMNQLLDEDLLKEEVKADYLRIRKEINDYLVEREINKDAPKPGPGNFGALKNKEKPPE